jgi:hypothetical protein
MNSELTKSLSGAVDWLIGIAQECENSPIGERGAKFPYTFWNGAIRGEYNVANKEWNSFCPIWHTGQAVKALTMAANALDRPNLIERAEFSAEFILRNRIETGKDNGLILAFEDHFDKINTSAILESLDGLFHLSQATGKMKYQNAALDALRWVAAHAWLPSDNVFNDVYDPSSQTFIHGIRGSQGRPLLDDAVFLTGWRITNEESLKEVAVGSAETLLRDENPRGNWLKYIPCNVKTGSIHPRHAFWWGMSMLEVYKATEDKRFLQCFKRSVDWYKNALRKDGGFLRGTYIDFNTDSFGHATSGTACAVISFLKYYEHTKDESIIEQIEKGLKFCMNMQFTNPDDTNLKGAILEKILPPDGTDRSPYQLRDLGTIFFIQAASMYLQCFKSI